MDEFENNSVEENTEKEAPEASAEEVAEDHASDPAEETAANDKKYTDEDVNRIVARRIAAERKRIDKLVNAERETSEIEERENNVRKREMMADTKDRLIKDGLPLSLSDILNYASEEELEASYNKVKECFNEAVTEGCKRALAGRTPRRGSTFTPDDPIAAAFAPPKAR